MTAQTLSNAALASEVAVAAALTPEALIAGPCALPLAPLAMPHQVIEQPHGLVRRLLAGLHLQTAPSAGTGH